MKLPKCDAIHCMLYSVNTQGAKTKKKKEIYRDNPEEWEQRSGKKEDNADE